MPVNVIDVIKPKNNGSFPVVMAQDVEVDEKRLPEVLNNLATNKADKTALSSLEGVVNTKANESTVNALAQAVEQKADKTDIPYVTPEMFGAVGDGITDDTEAII